MRNCPADILVPSVTGSSTVRLVVTPTIADHLKIKVTVWYPLYGQPDYIYTEMTVQQGHDRLCPDLEIFHILDGWTKCSQMQAWGLNAENVKEGGRCEGCQVHGILCIDPLPNKLEGQI